MKKKIFTFSETAFFFGICKVTLDKISKKLGLEKKYKHNAEKNCTFRYFSIEDIESIQNGFMTTDFRLPEIIYVTRETLILPSKLNYLETL